MEQSMKEDHFSDTNNIIAGATGKRNVIESSRDPDQVLNADDVDEEMFIFPDRQGKNQGEEGGPLDD